MNRLTTEIHMVASSDRLVVTFSLTPGNANDAHEGRALLDTMERAEGTALIMDRAYEGDETRAKSIEKGFVPIVPPKKN